MTVDELIERLEEARDQIGGDAEVRLMTQQNYPFENAVYGVTTGQAINEAYDNDNEGMADNVIYICEGKQLGYGTRRAWNTAV